MIDWRTARQPCVCPRALAEAGENRTHLVAEAPAAVLKTVGPPDPSCLYMVQAPQGLRESIIAQRPAWVNAVLPESALPRFCRHAPAVPVLQQQEGIPRLTPQASRNRAREMTSAVP